MIRNILGLARILGLKAKTSKQDIRAANQELASSIRSLADLHHSIARRNASAEFVIESLRRKGEHQQAERLEKLVAAIRASRTA